MGASRETMYAANDPDVKKPAEGSMQLCGTHIDPQSYGTVSL